MKYLNIILTACLFMLFACDFDDYNIDPTSLSEEQVTVNLILPKAQVQSAYNLNATAARYAGHWMQYFQGVEAQQNAITNYVVQDTDIDNPWSAQLYVGAMRDCITILNVAEGEANPSSEYAAVAKILLAQNLGFATQLWGDLPYSEAFQGTENLNPAFDTQEEIYATIQSLLAEAITGLQGETVGRTLGSDDLIYSGDTDAWVAAARSLSARYYLQTIKRNSGAAQLALNQLTAGALTSSADQPNFPFTEANNGANSLYLFELDRAATLEMGDYYVGTVLEDDPRKEFLVIEGDRNAFIGADLFWGRQNSPVPLISYSEQKFIEAEAILRVSAGNTAAASEALEEAILANMEVLGVGDSAAQAYATANSNLATSGNVFDQIITEKYKALYSQGMVEIWSDYRRTGFPSTLVPVTGATINIIPRRLLYPQNEKQANAASVAEAISRQGGDQLTDDLWVFAD